MVIPNEQDWKLNNLDITTFTTKGTGPGGQHRNKTESCVIMRHLPTGIEASASSKSQFQNKKIAREMLEGRVKRYYDEQRSSKINQQRLEDRGSGMRGDKIRTYRERDDLVIDHRNDSKFRLKDIRNGKLENLWK